MVVRFQKCTLAAALCGLFVAGAANAELVEIPVGTLVTLRVQGTISPATHTTGQTVLFSVDQNVVIDGRPVIAAGATGMGEVSAASKKGSVGKAASISVLARSVNAVDGTVIPLRGTKSVQGDSKTTESVGITVLCCIGGLLMKGEDAQILDGSTIDGYVLSATSVDL